MSESAPIVFLDSGVGGLPYLEWTRRRRPGENYLYVADRRHFPYGETPLKVLRPIILETVADITAWAAPLLIVVACNTASVVALQALRERFDLPFVGVVPALKTAAAQSRTRRIGLLATTRTVNDSYIDDLVTRFASDCSVARVGNGRIVDFVERRFLDAPAAERLEVLDGAIDTFREADIDTLVIGCTHFIYIEEELRKGLGEGVGVVDSVAGVGRQAIRVLDAERPPAREATGSGWGRLYVTGESWDEDDPYYRFARRFDLTFCGSVPQPS